ncbi:MAG: DUF3846 domain-containing protein [Clostridia bacterium]
MRAVIKEPMKRAYIKDIPDTLEALQSIVGGYIECVDIAKYVTAIVDEEGRLKDKPANVLGFVGTICIVGTDGDEFTDLSLNDATACVQLLDDD